MKKKVAKVFKKHGEKKIKVIKDFQPKTSPKGETTFAIKGSALHINQAIGRCMLYGTKEEVNLVGKLLIGLLYEDKDFKTGELIKY